MSLNPFPRPISHGLSSPGALATLVIPGRQNVFGTATIDAPSASATGLGEFSPTSRTSGVSRKEAASLLIPSLNVVLHVQVWPRDGVAGKGGLHFECADWRYLSGSAGPN